MQNVDERCQDESYTEEGCAITQPGPKTLHRGVGAPIDRDTATLWKVNLSCTDAPRWEYLLDASALSALLEEGAMGVFMTYAVDAEKRLHILPIGADADGMEMRNESVPTERGLVSWETAEDWRGRYTGAVRSRFFGANTFERLIAQRGSRAVRIEPAMNDSGALQMLLSNAGDDSPSEYEDRSFPAQGISPR